MKLNIKKGTVVLTHKQGACFDVRLFSPEPTDKDVFFDEDDVWFMPGDTSMGDEQLELVRDDTDSSWFDYMVNESFGFKLPENKMQIDYIVAPKGGVEIVKSKDDVSSHISESDKALRNIRRQTGNYSFPRQGLPR